MFWVGHFKCRGCYWRIIVINVSFLIIRKLNKKLCLFGWRSAKPMQTFPFKHHHHHNCIIIKELQGRVKQTWACFKQSDTVACFRNSKERVFHFSKLVPAAIHYLFTVFGGEIFLQSFPRTVPDVLCLCQSQFTEAWSAKLGCCYCFACLYAVPLLSPKKYPHHISYNYKGNSSVRFRQVVMPLRMCTRYKEKIQAAKVWHCRSSIKFPVLSKPKMGI